MDGAELVAPQRNRFCRKRTARLLTQVPSLRPWSTQRQDRDGGRETRARLHRSGLGGLGLEAKVVAMVGDDAEPDVAGAQRAGLRGVQVKKDRQVPAGSGGEADGEIESIADLPAVLGL